MESDPGFQAALAEAKAGLAQNGIPIGACLVAADGSVLGQGHNMRMQSGSAILHVRLSSSLSVQSPTPLLSGRDVGTRASRPPARRVVPGGYHVHHAVAVRHVHGGLHNVQGEARRHWVCICHVPNRTLL
jgi:hypothetical protein